MDSSFLVGLTLYTLVGMLVLGRMVDSLSIAPRHVCLLSSYEAVRGPYFTALLDQLAEQAGHLDALQLVLCYDDPLPVEETPNHAKTIQQDFSLSTCNILRLQDHNPISLWETLDQINPNIVWVTGSNPFGLRYRLRTSGLDDWIYRHCGNTLANGNGCVYVGEGAGAMVAGASLRIAHYSLTPGTPSPASLTAAAPEPQFFGLGLLGPDKTVAFTTLSIQEQEQLQASSPTDFDSSRLQLLTNGQVYVWSQSSDADCTSATSFVSLPTRRGMMEQMLSPEPLAALIDDTNPPEGVPCLGEPSIDPSKQLQQTGDSEWMDF